MNDEHTFTQEKEKKTATFHKEKFLQDKQECFKKVVRKSKNNPTVHKEKYHSDGLKLKIVSQFSLVLFKKPEKREKFRETIPSLNHHSVQRTKHYSMDGQ